MKRGIGSWALLFGASCLVGSCGGPARGGAGPGSTAGAEARLDETSATIHDFRGAWHGLAQMGAGETDMRALLLVVGQESVLCQRPAVGCVPVEVRVERGALVFEGELPAGGRTEALEGRLERFGESTLEGEVRSSACNCSGEARLDLAEEASFEGEWEATISFDRAPTSETRAFPAAFRAPEPFLLRVRAHGAEACSDAEGGCVSVEWVPQGPQAAFHFERTLEGVLVRTDGFVGRMSNGQIEGEVLRAGGDHRRHGRMYLREARSRPTTPRAAGAPADGASGEGSASADTSRASGGPEPGPGSEPRAGGAL